MPNKRSKRNQVHRFCCIYCERRLWRLGSPKHHLFYREVSEIKQHLNISRKNAIFLAAKGVYVDHNSWIEEFLCGEHGTMWLLVSKKTDGTLVAAPPSSNDWNRTTGTIDPSIPNPSVSEFTYRMSRRAGPQMTGRARSGKHYRAE